MVDVARELLAELLRHDDNQGGPWTMGMRARVRVALAAPPTVLPEPCGFIATTGRGEDQEPEWVCVLFRDHVGNHSPGIDAEPRDVQHYAWVLAGADACPDHRPPWTGCTCDDPVIHIVGARFVAAHAASAPVPDAGGGEDGGGGRHRWVGQRSARAAATRRASCTRWPSAGTTRRAGGRCRNRGSGPTTRLTARTAWSRLRIPMRDDCAR